MTLGARAPGVDRAPRLLVSYSRFSDIAMIDIGTPNAS
jgi:hypothetical protein